MYFCCFKKTTPHIVAKIDQIVVFIYILTGKLVWAAAAFALLSSVPSTTDGNINCCSEWMGCSQANAQNHKIIILFHSVPFFRNYDN